MRRRIRLTNLSTGAGWKRLDGRRRASGGMEGRGGKIEQTSPSWPVAAPDPSSLNSVPAAGVVKRPFYE